MSKKVYVLTSEGGALYQVESVWTTRAAADAALVCLKAADFRNIRTRARMYEIAECELEEVES